MKDIAQVYPAEILLLSANPRKQMTGMKPVRIRIWIDDDTSGDKELNI